MSRKSSRRAARQSARTRHHSHRSGSLGCSLSRRSGYTRTLRLEPLEDRRLLAVVTVDTLSDTVDMSDGLTSLREAIVATNLASGADTIQFDPALTASGPARILLTHGELKITDTLTISGPSARLLTVDASGSDPTPGEHHGDGNRVFKIDDGNSQNRISVSLSGLSLTGGDVLSDGGAIDSRENLTLTNSIVSGSAARFGGGLYSYGLFGQLTVTNCVFANNSAVSGGGINAQFGDLEITQSEFSANSASTSGGGLYTRAIAFHLTQSTVSGNSSGGDGGGITAAAGGAAPTIESSTISGNRANGNGGGVMLTAQIGLVVRRSTVTDNTADADGNGAGKAGGIFKYVDFPLTIDQSIVAANVARSGDGPDVSASVPSGMTVRYSLIGDGSGSSLAETPVGLPGLNGNFVGGTIHGAIDPKLGPLVYNGGSVLPDGSGLLTRALLAGSAAINLGDPSAVAGASGVPSNDERGAPFGRVVGGRIDIGAVESQPNPLPGDYNFDGVVDAADYTVWRDTLGSTTDLRADGTGSSSIDQKDWFVWKEHFGSTLPAGGGAIAATAFVEPAAVALGQTNSGVRTMILDIAPGSPAAKPLSDPPLHIETLSAAWRRDLLLEAWSGTRSDEHHRHDDWMDHLWSHEAAAEEPPGDVAAAVDSAFALLGVAAEE